MRRRRGATTGIHTRKQNFTAPATHQTGTGTTGTDFEDVSENNITTGDDFATVTLSPSLFPFLLYYISRLFSALLSVYLELEDRIETMALGLSRWFGGSEAAEEEESEKGEVQMERIDTGRKVKRRRRKASTQHEPAALEYYPGMVNLSGVLCYMNSVLQSLASVTSLIGHLERITTLAVETDLPTPVTDALTDVLTDLNTPQSRQPVPIRPHALLAALHPLPQIRRLLSTRDQQDAHELFIVLAEAISDEAMKVAIEVVRLRGMAEILSLQAYCFDKGEKKDSVPLKWEKGKEKRRRIRGLAQPWEGLIARRRVCRTCGWCGEVRMDTLGGMELPIPLSGDVSLESCIAEYLAPELLSGVTCEMCSLRHTLDFYRSEHARLSLPPNKAHLIGHAQRSSAACGSFAALENLPDSEALGEISDKRKRRAKEAKKVETRLGEMLESGIVTHFGEPTIPAIAGSSGDVPLKWQKVNSDSIREGMVTRPPQTLRLHITRSGMTPYGQLVKKSARVAFPLILDLTPFVAKGVWEERSNIKSMLANGTSQASSGGSKILYRLESVILHYGYTTSSGHFICIRRKPSNRGEHHGPVTVRKSCPDGCTCESCVYFGQVREQSVPGKGWLRVSDDEVEEVGQEALLESRAAIFMLFYEKVGEYQGGSKELAKSVES